MKESKNKFNKRLNILSVVVVVLIILLMGRISFLQVVRGEELKKGALQQWSKSIDIKSERGIIYDRMGKKMAVNMNGYSVWAYPGRISDAHKTAVELSKVLDIDEEKIYEKINKEKNNEKLSEWIDREAAEEIRKLKLSGIQLEEENKRFYPNENFAAHILGFTDIDNNGLYGVEKTFDKYLRGTPGKWLKMTDTFNRQLPYDKEKIHDPDEGLSVVLTLDETIQGFAEKAAEDAYINTNAKNVSVIVMNPKNGQILAMVNKPDYNPNEPRDPLTNAVKAEWAKLGEKDLQEKWDQQWRNATVNDLYEPGSTFKLITAAASLEENQNNPSSYQICTGAITDIPGTRPIRCAGNVVHGEMDFTEALSQSCNVSFVNIGRQLGKERLLSYIKAFGFGDKTYVDLLGEEYGTVPILEEIGEAQLATMSYGHGVAVTPIQLAAAISAISNGGDLYKPQIVDRLVDTNFNIMEEFQPEVRRKVISKQTSNTMLYMMEDVVANGLGSKAHVPGYRVGGKTGTTDKLVDGKYGQGKYIASFVGVAPIEDPELVVLAIVDEPEAGKHYGSVSAAPISKYIMENTFKYLDIKPSNSTEAIDRDIVEVPDIRGLDLNEATRKLAELGFRYTAEDTDPNKKITVESQNPEPGSHIEFGSIIDLALVETEKLENIVPYLVGKTRDEVILILDDLKVEYIFDGEGSIVRDHLPGAGEIYDKDTELILKME